MRYVMGFVAFLGLCAALADYFIIEDIESAIFWMLFCIVFELESLSYIYSRG